MAGKIPVNVPVDDKGKKRLEEQEKTWTAHKLVGLGIVSLGAALFLLIVMSQCQITPLPHM